MTQSPTKQELGKRAVAIFQKVKEVLPQFDWQWTLYDKHQEWSAEAKDPGLLDAVTLCNELTSYLVGWEIESFSYEEIHFTWHPLQKWRNARELKLSIVFNSDLLEIQVRSDTGKETPYDDTDPEDNSKWVTPAWYAPGHESYEYWQKQLTAWRSRDV